MTEWHRDAVEINRRGEWPSVFIQYRHTDGRVINGEGTTELEAFTSAMEGFMKTVEGKLKDKVKALLEARGFTTIASPVPNAVGYYNMPVPSGFGIPMLDFVCCYKGRFFMIETKAPGKDLTAQQHRTREAVIQAGGYVIADWDFDALKIKLETYLDAIDKGAVP